MKIKIELSEDECKNIILTYITDKMNMPLVEKNVRFYTKSKQNYKSEWEISDFKVVYER